MTIKSILCLFGGAQEELGAVSAALAIGEIHAAQVRFLHVSTLPALTAGIAGEGAMLGAEMIDAAKKDNKKRLDQARQFVTSFAAKRCIPLDAPTLPAHHASAQFLHATDFPDQIIAREGRLSDLIILTPGAADPEVLYDYAVISAIFDTGRPVLLIPASQGDTPDQWRDKTIAIAWDGEMEASRALYNAFPLIEKAEELQVIIAREHWKKRDVTAEDGLMAYLRAHGLHAKIAAVDCGQCSIGETLLGQARELRADLLVAGAYGHSRFREMILGGTTNHLIEKAELPLLLSH